MERFGFPVVSAENVYTVLEELGVRPWKKIETLGLEEYRARQQTSAQEKDMDRFAPRINVSIFTDPRGHPFVNFKPLWKSNSGAHVFTLLPGDLLPIAASFRHGAEVISLILPGGMLEDSDPNLAYRAKKEFEDETGIILDSVIPLTQENDPGTPLSAQQIAMRSCGFIGILPQVIKQRPQRLERREFLKIVLIPLKDWLTLIYSGKVYEASPIFSTFLALHKLNRLQVLDMKGDKIA